MYNVSFLSTSCTELQRSWPSVLSTVSGCYLTGVQIIFFSTGGFVVLACDELTV